MTETVPELILTPAGHLRVREPENEDAPADRWMKRVIDAFSAGSAPGLFALAARRPDVPPPPVFAFWRDFASRFMTELCRAPDVVETDIDPVPPPDPDELSGLLPSAPPMPGGEYLDLDVLQNLWSDLDQWVRGEIAESEKTLAAWLEKNAPSWRQVGRVCFHLAENRRDPDYPFAFLATYAPKLSKGGKVQYRPLGKALQEYAGAKNKKGLIQLLTPVQRAAEKVPFVRELVESGDIYHPIAWTPGEAYPMLKNAPLLEESGLLVKLPDWWRKRPRPRVAVTVGEKKKSQFGVDAMLDFRVDIALGDEPLTDEEWEELLSATDGLAYVKGQWVEVDPERLNEALDHWKRVEAEAAEDGLSFIEGMRLLAGASPDLSADGAVSDAAREWAYVDAGPWLSEVLSGLRTPEGLSGEGLPDGFRGALRPYQETGRNWLWFLANLGLGACLADDMGLGKTVQVLSLLLTLKEKGDSQKPSLLVLPASLLANWKAEIERFAPDLKTLFVHPSENDPAKLAKNPDAVLNGVDLAVTTYAMLSRQEWLREVSWRLAILDEAQAIKNPGTRQTRSVKQLRSQARIALTGTPVENRLADLWSLFDFLCPGLLGSMARFKKFVKSLEERRRERYAPLRNLVGPYVLRRLKTDKRIISDLPDKTEMKAFCGLSRKQAGLYAKSAKELERALAESEGDQGIQRRGMVLAYLMRFKQICNHPSQFLGDGGYKPGDSGKFDRLAGIGEEIAGRQEKALVFTQFREMTEPLAAFLAEVFGREGLVLHGGTAVKKRQKLIDRFQREDGPPFFVLSLKAGGTGLNLTAASHVIHFDRWWNPAVENQATDRAFRIGQHRNVVVHKFVCRGTIEERIDAMIEEKTRLAEDILEGGPESMLTEMSDEELLNIVALDIDRAQM